MLYTQVLPILWTYLPLGTDVIYHHLSRDKFCTLHSIHDSQFSGYLLRVQYMATVIFWVFSGRFLRSICFHLLNYTTVSIN